MAAFATSPPKANVRLASTERSSAQAERRAMSNYAVGCFSIFRGRTSTGFSNTSATTDGASLKGAMHELTCAGTTLPFAARAKSAAKFGPPRPRPV